MPEVEPGPGEALVAAESIDTSNVQLEDEPAPAHVSRRVDPKALADQKEMINAEIVRALRENLENPVFPVLIVHIFDLGGALCESGLNADMPPLHRLLIGSVALIIVIGATNPDVVEKIAGKWKKMKKTATPPHEPEVRPSAG